jgi:hypothetical protein
MRGSFTGSIETAVDGVIHWTCEHDSSRRKQRCIVESAEHESMNFGDNQFFMAYNNNSIESRRTAAITSTTQEPKRPTRSETADLGR